MEARMHSWHMIFICFLLVVIVHATLYKPRRYYIEKGEIPSYLYRKFENVKEDIFPSSITIKAAFSALKGTLLYSIDKNMNQLIVTMRDDVHIDTRYGLQVELNTQMIIVSLSKLCGQEGNLFDERSVLTLKILITTDWITLISDVENVMKHVNERRSHLHDNYPIPYQKSDIEKLTTNEAHLWLVNHPMFGEIYPNRDQMYGCIFNVFYDDQPIYFTNMSSNIGDTCNITCVDNMCNGGQCNVIYGKEPACNCTEAFLNGRLCSNKIRSMNFRTHSQTFVFKMFKLSWKSTTNTMLQLNNGDIHMLFGRNISNLFFEYNFMNYSRKTEKVTLSDEYRPNHESICIVYFQETMIYIRTYTNHKWNSICIPSIVDIRQTQIYTMVFSSGEGVMDFVFKFKEEDLWISPDFNTIIELEKEPDQRTKIPQPNSSQHIIISLSVLIASICVVVFIFLIIFFLYKREKKRFQFYKRFQHYEFVNDVEAEIYVTKCMSEIGWDLVRNTEDTDAWMKYIIQRIRPRVIANKSLKRIHALMSHTAGGIFYRSEYLRDIIILFIHTRVIVLPSMLEQNNTRSIIDTNQSIQQLLLLMNRHKYECESNHNAYLLPCFMDLIEDISQLYNDNRAIYPLIDTVVSFVSCYSILGGYKYNRNVRFLESFICLDNSVAVWPVVILSLHYCEGRFIKRMKEYIHNETKDGISDDAMIVYYATIRIMSKNKYMESTFTNIDYQLLHAILETKYDRTDIRWHMNQYSGNYIMNIFNVSWTKEMKNCLEENSLTEHHKILINCLSFVISRDDYGAIDTDCILYLLIYLYEYVSISVIHMRMAELILYQLSIYPVSNIDIIKACEKYECSTNTSEEIRLYSSTIIGSNM